MKEGSIGALVLKNGEKLDLIAVSAHPDDTELGCGGTLAKAVKQGYKVGIIDLTDGEPTPRNETPEIRLEEAKKAAEILGVHRTTLNLPNRKLFDTFETRVALAKKFRELRPSVVIVIGGKTILASPDHYQAQMIVEAAVFYSRLTKWEKHFENLPVHRINKLLYFPVREGVEFTKNTFIVDISETFDIKMKAVRAYKSQFPPEAERFLQMIETRCKNFGSLAGVNYGELFASPGPLMTQDIMKLALP